MRFAYWGNFRPEHSTENHVAASLRDMGHQVEQLQEDEEASWLCVGERAATHGVDAFLWTRTWHLPQFDQAGALVALRAAGVPSVMFHLDRWWGLDREHQVRDEPIFRCDLVVTADGGHDEKWAAAGVNHRWLPPAIYRGEAERVGTFKHEWSSDVAFVGSWRAYHTEWHHRLQLVAHLGKWYGSRFRTWPQGGRAVRGQNLSDLYASVKVIVGDSCLLGDIARYHSDRIPETLGRGGFLIHPRVNGVMPELYKDGEHLDTWEIGDWTTLRAKIDARLADAEGRARVAAAGREHVLANHTYEHRMRELIGIMAAEGTA